MQTYGTLVHESPQQEKAGLREVVLWAVAAMGISAAGNAVLAGVVTFSALYGKESFLFINIAISFPSLPVSIIQARWDAVADRRFGSSQTFLFRGVLVMITIMALCAAIPVVVFRFGPAERLAAYRDGNASATFERAQITAPLSGAGFGELLSIACAIGFFSTMLFGSLNQFAAFGSSCGRLPAAVAFGFQGSGAAVLALSLCTGFFGRPASPGETRVFFDSVAGFEAVALAAFLGLFCHKRLRNALRQRDATFEDEDETRTRSTSLLDPVAMVADSFPRDPRARSSSLVGKPRSGDDDFEELTFRELLEDSWPCCSALFFSVALSISIVPFLAYVQGPPALPQQLFFIRLACNTLGRPFTVWYPTLLTQRRLLVAAVAQAAFLPGFLIYVFAGTWQQSGLVLSLIVAASSFCSGYVSTSAYQLTRLIVPFASLAKVASLMNVIFSSSLIFGLLLSFSVSYLL